MLALVWVSAAGLELNAQWVTVAVFALTRPLALGSCLPLAYSESACPVSVQHQVSCPVLAGSIESTALFALTRSRVH